MSTADFNDIAPHLAASEATERAKNEDNMSVGAIRDILIEALVKFSPAVRTALTQTANKAMSHICARLETLETQEMAAVPPPPVKDHRQPEGTPNEP